MHNTPTRGNKTCVWVGVLKPRYKKNIYIYNEKNENEKKKKIQRVNLSAENSKCI